MGGCRLEELRTTEGDAVDAADMISSAVENVYFAETSAQGVRSSSQLLETVYFRPGSTAGSW